MDALAAVGDRDLRGALVFARAAPEPVTADQLAEVQQVHRNVARHRLERLAEAGLLVSSFERRTGRVGPGAGRPAKTYAVAPELEAIQFPDRHYEALLGILLDTLPTRGRAKKLHEVGVEFGEQLAADAGLRPVKAPRAAVEAMCAAVRRLGYQASVIEVTDSHAAIATPTCPLRPFVRKRPEATELDRGMWTGLAARALKEVKVEQVECETHDCLFDHGSCRVLLTLKL
jgi:predicted ArsR family transcriptional regulator